LLEPSGPVSEKGARDLAKAHIALYKNSSTVFEFITGTYGLQPGHRLSVALGGLGINTTYLVESVTLRQQEAQLEWAIKAVVGASLGNWITALKDLNGNYSAAFASGTSAGTTDVPPGTLIYTPALYEYGSVSLNHCSITGNTAGVSGLSVNLVFIDELTTDVFVTTDAAMDATTDPVTIPVVPNPARTTPTDTLDFAIGDWLLFQHIGHYELAQLTAKTGNTWTIARHYPGTDPGEATFESMMVAHDAGTLIYKAQVRSFLFDSRAGTFVDSTNGKIPGRFDMPLANCCVLAIVAAAYGTSYGPWTVYNCATATVPGLRTLNGGNYTFQKSGGLMVQELAGIPKKVQYASSLRLLYATLLDPPEGSDFEVRVKRRKAGATIWQELAPLVIHPGKLTSYDGETMQPSERRIPYGTPWPCPVLFPDDDLTYDIIYVGSDAPGSGLTVEVFT
jgi:hypothetical protein